MTYASAIDTLRVSSCFPAESYIEAARCVLALAQGGRREDVKLAKSVLKGDLARRIARRASHRAAQQGRDLSF